jgi:hypothetical protein
LPRQSEQKIREISGLQRRLIGWPDLVSALLLRDSLPVALIAAVATDASVMMGAVSERVGRLRLIPLLERRGTISTA